MSDYDVLLNLIMTGIDVAVLSGRRPVSPVALL